MTKQLKCQADSVELEEFEHSHDFQRVLRAYNEVDPFSVWDENLNPDEYLDNVHRYFKSEGSVHERVRASFHFDIEEKMVEQIAKQILPNNNQLYAIET